MVDFFKRIILAIREYLILIVLLLISLSLISQNDTPALQKVKSFGFINVAVINSVINHMNFFSGDSDEIEALRKRNAQLMLSVNKLREYAIENKEIKSMLGLKDTSTAELVSSKIISKHFGNISGNVILDKGLSDSLKVGMPVINQFGLVGIVYKTSDDFSLVRTLRNARLNIAVECQRSGVQGILSWQAEKLVMKNIPTTYDVKVGDRIITSDFSTLFPPSIPIGVVAEKESNISGLVSDIVIQPYVDLDQIRNLFVMKLVMSKELKNFELNLLKEQGTDE